MQKGQKTIYFGGVPTGPDVNKLVDKYPIEKLILGYKMPYSEISEVIEQPIRSSRFRSVTEAWRKKMEKDYNIIIRCDSFESQFYVLTEGNKVDFGGEKLRCAVNAARRTSSILSRVVLNKLTEEEKKNYDFFSARAGGMVATAQLRSGKKLLPEITDK